MEILTVWTIQQPSDMVRKEKLRRKWKSTAGKGFIRESDAE